MRQFTMQKHVPTMQFFDTIRSVLQRGPMVSMFLQTPKSKLSALSQPREGFELVRESVTDLFERAQQEGGLFYELPEAPGWIFDIEWEDAGEQDFSINEIQLLASQGPLPVARMPLTVMRARHEDSPSGIPPWGDNRAYEAQYDLLETLDPWCNEEEYIGLVSRMCASPLTRGFVTAVKAVAHQVTAIALAEWLVNWCLDGNDLPRLKSGKLPVAVVRRIADETGATEEGFAFDVRSMDDFPDLVQAVKILEDTGLIDAHPERYVLDQVKSHYFLTLQAPRLMIVALLIINRTGQGVSPFDDLEVVPFFPDREIIAIPSTGETGDSWEDSYFYASEVEAYRELTQVRLDAEFLVKQDLGR